MTREQSVANRRARSLVNLLGLVKYLGLRRCGLEQGDLVETAILQVSACRSHLMSFWPARTTATKQGPLEAARASLRELSELGIEIPSHIAGPIIEALRLGDLTNATPGLQQQFWTAYGTLNSRIKSPEEAKRYYRRFFYGILSALLLLQLYYSSFITVQKGLLNVGSMIEAAEAAPPVDGAAGNADLKTNDLYEKRKTYLNATEYLMGVPRKFGGLLTVIGLGTDPQSANRPEIVAQVELELATSFAGGFLLPLLYGMLGAIAFVLRRLSDESLSGEARTLKRRYSLRVPIGALSGLAAGWLLQPATGSMTASLSPFALAFVAGYSADLVFAAMDRIVAAFSAAPPAPPEAAAARPDPLPDRPRARAADAAASQSGPPRGRGDGPPAEQHTPPAWGNGREQAQEPGEAPIPSSRAQANL
ncbi:hypothetical protein QA635_33940 [Bradyrhizobium brasilense]|uniref:hypothetical protein n=1 Tax=Bradyrhizobium brasilense TaxID=1419277 RepID=UPI0024B21222|nr:hypothetical protein [Bradyrhizobium australafricanum]WFU31485.1 hypothetical protein QA635_33940 [Bradyrhizobium australafricanum]